MAWMGWRRSPARIWRRTRRAWGQGINPHESLAQNDGHGFFEVLGASIVTGPTLTNVNDFRAVLITEEGPHDPSCDA